MAALNWERFTLVTDNAIEKMRNHGKTINTSKKLVKCVGDMVQRKEYSFGNQGIQTDYSWNSMPKWRTNIILRHFIHANFFLFILLSNHLWVFWKAETALTKVALAISAFWKTRVQINSKLNKRNCMITHTNLNATFLFNFVNYIMSISLMYFVWSQLLSLRLWKNIVKLLHKFLRTMSAFKKHLYFLVRANSIIIIMKYKRFHWFTVSDFINTNSQNVNKLKSYAVGL